MININNKITLPVFKKLANITGVSQYNLFKLINPQLEINTLRTQKNLATEVVHFSNKITEIANVLGCKISDLNIILNTETIDSDIVIHELCLNNENIIVGNYYILKDELVIIESVNNKACTVLNYKSKEKTTINTSQLQHASWYKIFMLRDGIQPDDIYSHNPVVF